MLTRSDLSLRPEVKLKSAVQIQSEQTLADQEKNQLWYKDAVIYQLHVRAFFDNNDDGIGDFAGLIRKLDYLAELGVTAIWLLPFYPSPLKDDGYDIADYTGINPAYGTISDFKLFLHEAHARGLRVITELVINHTSDQHDWFQRSRRAPPGSYWRDFYVWSDDPNRYKGVRIIFKDFEASNWSWDPVAKSYYWHRFYAHQPDLNFDNPAVHRAVLDALDFWMEMGVDGLRLDAVPYLFEREGTSCENLPETHEFLRKLRAHVRSKYPDRMLLAEANQWPEDAVAYFGNGDECHMCFHFPLMPRLFMALKMEDRHSIIDILNQTPEIPEDCQWATFLRNHDELTLEMVTDEERDYMYKVYARDPRARINLGVRRRLAPLMENDRRQIELLNALLFSLPGSPIIYYGDEIGMGDNIYLGDRDGVRTPFQWSPDRNAGFSRANPQKLFLPVIASPEFHSETVNVETQSANPNSFYWWMRRLIALRRNSQELSRGKIEFVENSNSKVLSFTRTFEGRTVLCVFNLARSTQHVDLDLSRHKLRVPAELFAGNDFPSIGEEAYFLTLAPYSFMWFALRDRTSAEVGFDSAFDASRGLLRDSTPLVIAREPLQALLSRETWLSFESGLRSYLPRMRWFAGKDRKITGVELDDLIFVRHEESEGGSSEAGLAVLKVSFREGLEEHYLLGIAYAESERAQKIRETHPELIMAQYHRGRGEHQSSGIYYDAILDGGFSRAILFSALRGETLTGLKGRLECEREMRVDDSEIVSVPPPSLSSLEQSNCSVFFGRRFFLKLYRRVEEGESPEVEVGRYLTRKEFEGSAPLLSSLVYRRGGKEFGCGIIQRYLPNEMDGWSLMLDQLARIGETALTRTPEALRLEIPGAAARGKQDIRPPENLIEIAGYSLELASELGRMTASLHRALGSDDRDKEFIPEAFTPFHQRSLFQSFRNLTVRNLQKLRAALSILPERTRDLAKDVISCEGDILDTFFEIRREPIEAPRIRIHGDLQLGQVLFTGVHFRVIDFEGEPGRGIGERRLKRSPLKDVASMLRSFEYAAEYYLKEKIQDDEPRRRLRPVVLAWARWAESEYLHSYLYAMEGANLLPVRASQLESLLRVHVLEKALDEIAYELRSRPDWIEIPLRGVLSLVEENEQ